MFFPRKPGLRRGTQRPPRSTHRSDDLKPELKLSRLELMALLLIR